MKARVKATGEIVHVGDYNTIHHDPMYKNERTGPWRLEELDFTETPDYWTRLEHQYVGMAMQGILGSEEIMMRINKMPIKEDKFGLVIAELSTNIAHALVEKLKEKEEK